MRTKLVLVSAVVVVAGIATAVALAGGWAVTTVHPLEARPTPGTPLRVTFTIRQHGHRPAAVEDTAIEIIGEDGQTLRFPALPLPQTGRYAADVVFPSAGAWGWRAIPGWFPPQSLGVIQVSEPGTGARTPALDGRNLFKSKGCASCHVGPETSPRVNAGPSLADAAKRFAGKAGLAYIRQSILVPKAVVVPGGGYAGTPLAMPKLEVSRTEAEAIARYLQRTR